MPLFLICDKLLIYQWIENINGSYVQFFNMQLEFQFILLQGSNVLSLDKRDYLMTQYSDIDLSFESKTIAIFITLSLRGSVSP